MTLLQQQRSLEGDESEREGDCSQKEFRMVMQRVRAGTGQEFLSFEPDREFALELKPCPDA